MRLKADPDRRARVLIVGAGVAGCKACVDLRELAGHRVEIELISPEPTFEWRGVAVAAGFDQDRTPSIHISQLADSIGARYTRDPLAGVHPSAEMVTLASGATRPCDILLAATGARLQEAIPGAITFGTPRGIQGDVVASPTKHEALVRQQAVAAVAAIAGRLGALPTAPSASHQASLQADLDPERVGSALAGG